MQLKKLFILSVPVKNKNIDHISIPNATGIVSNFQLVICFYKCDMNVSLTEHIYSKNIFCIVVYLYIFVYVHDFCIYGLLMYFFKIHLFRAVFEMFFFSM